MKLNELVGEFAIYRSNEEQQVLDQFDQPLPESMFDERQRVVIESLVRKSLLSKVSVNNQVILVKNEI